jgi:hypothetical protein
VRLVSMRIKHGNISSLISKSDWTTLITCNTGCSCVSVVATAHHSIVAFKMGCALPTKNGHIRLHRYSITMNACASTGPHRKMRRYRESRHVFWNCTAEDHSIWICHSSTMWRLTAKGVVSMKGSLPARQIAMDDRVG